MPFDKGPIESMAKALCQAAGGSPDAEPVDAAPAPYWSMPRVPLFPRIAEKRWHAYEAPARRLVEGFAGYEGCATPVAVFAFNRPDHTAAVFQAVALAKPKRLFLVCDGSRDDHPTDADRSAAVREILAGVDWECDVETNFSDCNMGCRDRMASGIDWVFSRAERAILIEDDVLPSVDFFRFCDAMLERYADDPHIGVVNGSYLPDEAPVGDGSYIFSRYPLVWGWATWRDRWERYERDFAGLGEDPDASPLPALLGRADVAKYYDSEFRRVMRGDLDTWDYALAYTSFVRGWLNVTPRCNLVSNIGFGPDATHTLAASPLAAKRIEALDWPLKQSAMILRSISHDNFMDGPIIALMKSSYPDLIISEARDISADDAPSYYGIYDLDRHLSDLLPFRGGIFFEAGANDGFKQSNTLHFERHKSWTGVLVEPSPIMLEECRKVRPASQCFNAALVPPDWIEPIVNLTFCDLMSVTNSELVALDKESHVAVGSQFLKDGIKPFVYQAPARTISSILEEAGVYHVDLLVLDVEGFEAAALRGIDFARFQIDYLCIECWNIAEITALISETHELIDKLTVHDYIFRRITGVIDRKSDPFHSVTALPNSGAGVMSAAAHQRPTLPLSYDIGSAEVQ